MDCEFWLNLNIHHALMIPPGPSPSTEGRELCPCPRAEPCVPAALWLRFPFQQTGLFLRSQFSQLRLSLSHYCLITSWIFYYRFLPGNLFTLCRSNTNSPFLKGNYSSISKFIQKITSTTRLLFDICLRRKDMSWKYIWIS